MSTAILDESTLAPRRSSRGEPPWEIATLFPSQGMWSEGAFLALRTNRLVELNDGCLEVLPVPSYFHELIVEFLHDLLRAFVNQRALGRVMRAPLPIRLWPGQMREPDILFLRPERLEQLRQRGNKAQPDGADLVVEVVSPGEESRDRDLDVKRTEYAKAGIAEYWIVDPETRSVTVLSLDGETYTACGTFAEHETAVSKLFPEFSVPVRDIFQAAEPSAE